MFLGLYMILKMSIYIPLLVCAWVCVHIHVCMCMCVCAGALSRIVINDKHTLL